MEKRVPASLHRLLYRHNQAPRNHFEVAVDILVLMVPCAAQDNRLVEEDKLVAYYAGYPLIVAHEHQALAFFLPCWDGHNRPEVVLFADYPLKVVHNHRLELLGHIEVDFDFLYYLVLLVVLFEVHLHPSKPFAQ